MELCYYTKPKSIRFFVIVLIINILGLIYYCAKNLIWIFENDFVFFILTAE